MWYGRLTFGIERFRVRFPIGVYDLLVFIGVRDTAILSTYILASLLFCYLGDLTISMIFKNDQ